MARGKSSGVAGDHVRVLVLFEADPVPGAVHEIGPEPALSITSRAAASTSLQGSPTRAATVPAAWASATTS